MQLQKLMKCLNKVDHKYLQLIHSVINDILHEIVNSGEGCYDNDAPAVSTDKLIKEITAKTNNDIAGIIITCVFEFCITSTYVFENESWNFINYYLKHYKNKITSEEQVYLKSLNNSYMSIYKVISTSPGTSITLKNQIEKKLPSIIAIDEALSCHLTKGSYIAVRPVKKNTADNVYELSCAVLPIPEPIVKECVHDINNITKMMFDPLTLELVRMSGTNATFEDNATNRLQAKKIWTKEIIERVYSYYVNYADYHEILDYDGNPWQPCIIEFDVIVSAAKIKKALSSIKEFKYDEQCSRGNTWLWLSKHYKELNSKNLKKQLPPLSCSDSNKSPKFHGAFITNECDGESYHVFAEIKLLKNKLLVEVDSKQRANIVQDQILTELAGLISYLLTHSQS